MDYKHIEEILNRYWEAETTLEEERELRRYFTEEADIPAHLRVYAPMFGGLAALQHAPVVKARPLTWRKRMTPLWKAAACIALCLSAGALMQRSMQPDVPQVAATEPQPEEGVIEVQVAYEPALPVDSAKVIDETY